ncbi:MAG: hypothetical protein ACK4IY_03930 [Chitinophagales bacterium]
MKYLIAVFFFCASVCSAQQIHIQAGNAVGILYNAEFDLDMASGFTFSSTYTSVLRKLNVIYNLGAEYSIAGWGNQVLLQTGISKVWMRPSGFIRAADKESVTYIKSNWLVSTDLNMYNGVALFRPAPLYVFAVEPAVIAAYKTGDRFFISGTVAPRFTWCPGYIDYGEINSYTDILFKIGVAWFLDTKRFKP